MADGALANAREGSAPDEDGGNSRGENGNPPLSFTPSEVKTMHANYLTSLKEIEELKKVNRELLSKIASLESSLDVLVEAKSFEKSVSKRDSLELGNVELRNTDSRNWVSDHKLNAEMIKRYSRHLLIPKFGVKGQEKLINSSVLIIGLGGLGSPCALYLAASGIGKIGIVDKDFVDLSNIHRQVIHPEDSVGNHKVKSAAESIKRINSLVNVEEYYEGISPKNAVDIISKYDVVLDCTDNIGTRYLINDACVIANKALVWGAALGLEGQATVYNYEGCLCYRCLFPNPPPQASCQRCSDSGVLGIVPGIIGCIQVLETIKIICKLGKTLSSQMLIFDALSTETRIFRLRSKKEDCIVCGNHPQITIQNLHEYDYEKFTQGKMNDGPPEPLTVVSISHSVSTETVKRSMVASNKSHVLLDVRASHEYSISALPGSVNIPLSNLPSRLAEVSELVNAPQELGDAPLPPIYVICRRGNDSQLAVQMLMDSGLNNVFDVTGGLEAWAQTIEVEFPIY